MYRLKSIVNKRLQTYSVMHDGILFLHGNTHHIMLYKKKYFFLNIYFSFYEGVVPWFYDNNWFFLSIYRSKASCPYNGVLFTQEIPREIIVLYMGVDLAFKLYKTGNWEKQVISL